MNNPNQSNVLATVCGNQPHKKPAMYITTAVITKCKAVLAARLQFCTSKITVPAAKVVPIKPVIRYWINAAASFVFV